MDIKTLEEQVKAAITAFDNNRVALYAAAEKQGGDDAVNNLAAQYEALGAQYEQLLANELAANDPAYEDLSNQAAQETKALKESITTMNDINQTISALSTVITVVASIAALV